MAKLGSELNSSLASAKVLYAWRDIETLERLKLISPEESALMSRANSVDAGWSMSGGIEPSALSILETPQVERTLFAEEKALRAQLWQHFEWVELDTPEMVVLPPFLEGVEVQPAKAEALDYSDSFVISLLDEALHRTAARVQLISNGDGKADTLSVADTDATADVEGFTSQDREEIDAIRTALLSEMNSRPTTIKPIVSVPTPGITKLNCQHPGTTPVYLTSNIRFTENRQLSVRGSTMTRCQESLEISREVSALVDVPENSQVVLRKTDRNDELVLEAGTHTIPKGWSGVIRLELWRQGTRVEHSNVNLPERVDSAEDFGEYLNYELRSNGDPLPRRLIKRTDSTSPRSGAGQVSYVFDHSWDKHEAEELPDAEEAGLKCEFPHLQPGSYRFEAWGEKLQLDLFGQGTLRLTLPNGEAVNLRPGNGGANPQYEGQTRGDGGFSTSRFSEGTQVSFHSDSGLLIIGSKRFYITKESRFA